MEIETMGNKANSKGCSYNSGLIIVIIVLVFWTFVGTSLFSEYPFVLLTALIPLGSLILSWYEQRIGGLLIILSGISPIIIIISIPSLKSDDFYGIGLMAIALFVTLPLCVAGIIIRSAKPRKIESREKETIDDKESLPITWECEECGADVKDTDKTCPKCGVEFEVGR